MARQMTLALSVVLGGAIIQSARAAVIYVDDSATGANDGSNWTNACVSLQGALAVAHNGDEIRVGQGTYKPADPGGDRTATFLLVNGSTVQGGYAGVDAANPDALDPTQFLTTLSGGNYFYHVVTADGVSASTSVRGVVISGGNANAQTGCTTTPAHDRGGGLFFINGASPLVQDCTIQLNSARCQGAGVWYSGGTPTFRNCRFEANHLPLWNGAIGAGAAAYGSASFMFENCQFIQNGPADTGGALQGSGGLIRGCRFEGHFAGDVGGAISGNQLVIVDSLFLDNSSQNGGGTFTISNCTLINCRVLGSTSSCCPFSGAIYGNHLTLVNCLLSGNDGQNGAMVVSQSSVINCTIVGNSANQGAGGIFSPGTAPTNVSNCVLWNNSSGDAADAQGAQVAISNGIIRNSCIMGWNGALGGYGNFGDDPQFIDADGADDQYGTEDDNARLSESSPCRDAGNDAYLPPDTDDLDQDGNTVERVPLDLDLLPRFISGVVDLGAFEIQAQGCPSDVSSSDGQVNSGDLLAVINNWGQCASSDCPPDITNDGSVNTADLLFVLNHWGACP